MNCQTDPILTSTLSIRISKIKVLVLDWSLSMIAAVLRRIPVMKERETVTLTLTVLEI